MQCQKETAGRVTGSRKDIAVAELMKCFNYANIIVILQSKSIFCTRCMLKAV